MSHCVEYERLIALISAAADASLFSLEAWQAYLGAETETVRLFSAQLAYEWQPLRVPSALCQTVMAQAQAHLAAGGLSWRNLWSHVLRVTGNALLLAGSAEISPEHAFLLGILHDVGKLDELRQGTPHEFIGARLARQWLTSELPAAIIERLAAAIAKRGAQCDPFVQVLHDADKLDKIGATGLLRRLSSHVGEQNPAAALRIVLHELAHFPKMHFTESARLAERKRDFTTAFLARMTLPAG
jgi:HD superfamily phosphodiesterase